MPREEYRLVKNRKIARLCRLKRKNERGDMQNSLEKTTKDLDEAYDKIAELEQKLKESEKQKLYFE